MGGAGPESSTVRSSISCAATAASRCSTVWIVDAPLPMAVRRSTASTSDRSAGIRGFPARATRLTTIPCPAGAGRKVASVRAPVCRPVPETLVFLLMPRLALGLIGPPHECLEIVHDVSEPVQRTLGPQELPVGTRRVAGHRGARCDVPNHAPLHRDAGAASDRHVVRESRLARAAAVVLDVSTPRDPRLAGDEATRADATVVPDLHEVVDLGSRADHRVVHAAAIARRVGPDLHVVPDDAATHLGNLARHLAVLPRDVAEAVRAESHTRVQNDAVAHDRAAVAP